MERTALLQNNARKELPETDVRCTASLAALALGVLLLSGCKGFIEKNIAPPIAKASMTVLSPFAGRGTMKEMDDALHADRLGYFTGEPRLEFIAPNLLWFYQPEDPKQRFSFTSRLHTPYGDKEWRIEPGSMFFDGASVPRWLWEAEGFGPFDFTKSAIIHDWLFEAHHLHEIYMAAISSAKTPDEIAAFTKMRDRYAAYGSNANDKAIPATHEGMGVRDAALIMAECMRREMEMTGRKADFVNETIQRVSTPSALEKPTTQLVNGNTIKGLEEIKGALAIGKKQPHVLGFYRKALETFIADSVYNPKTKSDSLEGDSAHASTLTTVRALRTNPNGAKLVEEKIISTWLAKQFDSLERADQTQGAKSAKAELVSLDRAVKVIQQAQPIAGVKDTRVTVYNVTLPRGIEVTPELRAKAEGFAGGAGALGAITPVSTLPDTVEVRYYRHPEDRDGAQGILDTLIRLGVVEGAVGGRVSYVIDPPLAQNNQRREFQIALSRKAADILIAKIPKVP